MPEKRSKTPKWLADAQEHDYPAAKSYLSLIFPTGQTAKLISKLRVAKLVQFKAKDIFRASQLSLLGVSNSHVERDGTKIRTGVPLSPVLLVRDTPGGKVIIADGYHRVCAVYLLGEDAIIPCKIV